MHIQFFGAAGTVTGSNFLLTDSRSHGIVVDMGMFQGNDELEKLNYQPLGFDASDVHSVLLTHAHLDHCGRIPLLVKNGFRGKSYMTPATRDIVEVVLLDAAKIMRNDDDKPISYTKDDVTEFLETVETVSYGDEVDLGTVSVLFRNAGHILGSASIEVKDTDTGKIVAFSGDLGNSPEEIVAATEYIKRADIAVIESTYGDKSHPNDDPETALRDEVNAVEKSGGALLIPSFSIERTQVLLHMFKHLKESGMMRADTPVFMDSPMSRRVTDIYKRYPSLYNKVLAEKLKLGDPFDFNGLREIASGRESDELKNIPGPKVIIAGSGMMVGGRIVSHAKYFLPVETTRLLIVGFQAEETLGRQLEEGQKVVDIEGESIAVNANVRAIHSMSSHADQPKLMRWLEEIDGLKEVCLVHGENPQREAFSELISQKLSLKAVLPELGSTHFLE